MPRFLAQLTAMLPGGNAKAGSQVGATAARHRGELLHRDFIIEQVVHDYGDLCQSITELATKQGAAITAREFGILNINLDNAIAGRGDPGRLRALVPTGLMRSPTLHNLPTMAEQGYPGFEAAYWYAFVAPAKMSAELLDRWNRELVKLLSSQNVRKQLLKHERGAHELCQEGIQGLGESDPGREDHGGANPWRAESSDVIPGHDFR